jgi:hypothetical protein
MGFLGCICASTLQSGSDDAEQTLGLFGREAIGHETPENRDNE